MFFLVVIQPINKHSLNKLGFKMDHTFSLGNNTDLASFLSFFSYPSTTSANQLSVFWKLHDSNSIKASDLIPMSEIIDSFFIVPTMLASEKILNLDWNLPEEDEAWQDL